MLYSHLRLVLPSGLFTSGFLTRSYKSTMTKMRCRNVYRAPSSRRSNKRMSESSRVTCNLLPNFLGLADFPLVFIFSMHQKEGNQRVVEEPSNWWVADPYLIVEMYYSHRKKCRRSITATTSLSHSLIPFFLHKWWELYHVMSLAREKRIGLADISRIELERNFAVSRVQNVKPRHLSFHRTTFCGLNILSYH